MDAGLITSLFNFDFILSVRLRTMIIGSPDITLLIVGAAGLSIMFLINRRDRYSPMTRLLMDVLAAVTIGAFLLVALRQISSI